MSTAHGIIVDNRAAIVGGIATQYVIDVAGGLINLLALKARKIVFLRLAQRHQSSPGKMFILVVDAVEPAQGIRSLA